MREIAVYYCTRCGYYAYYQSSVNAQCPKCIVPMNILRIKYRDFIELGYQERDELLSSEIIKHHPSILERISVEQKQYSQREIVAHLSNRVEELEIENKKMNETVTWMHQTIWDLIKKEREIK